MIRLCSTFLLLLFSSFVHIPVWSKPPSFNSATELIVVLKDQPVLAYQKQLSGGKNIYTSQFKQQSSMALEYAKQLDTKQQSVERAIKQIALNAKVHQRISHIINALVVTIDSSSQHKLDSIQDIKYYAPVTTVYPSLTKSHELMNVSPAWEQLGGRTNAGEGIYVGVIDTGMDLDHPAFSDTGYELPPGFPKGNIPFTNNKVIASHTFPPFGLSQGDRTPEDKTGHGTHVASCAVSNLIQSPQGMMSGVAPRAYAGNYKIFFGSGGANSSQVITAIDQAVRDGMHILNMSFSSELLGDPQHDPQMEAVQNAIDMGVTCVIAAGNKNRVFTIGNPQQVKDAITVAASTNSHNLTVNINEVVVSAQTEEGEFLFQDAPGNLSTGRENFTELYYHQFQIQSIAKLAGNSFDNELCIDFPDGISTNDWLLVSRGNCDFTDKVIRAESIGAKGVLFYDNIDDPLATTAGVDDMHIPSLIIEKQFGLQIETAIAQGREITIFIRNQAQPSNPNKAASFNSIGPSVNYSLKPDISAVGLGSYAASQNDFNSTGNPIESPRPAHSWLSGTSMAAPRIAGLAALIKQQYPNWPPSFIKSAMVLSATRILENSSNNNTSQLTITGAGLADSHAALNLETLVIPPMVGFGAQTVFENTSATEWIEVINLSNETSVYTLSQPDTTNQPNMIPSVSQFILDPSESIHIALTAQLSPSLLAKDYEVLLKLDNLTTGGSLPIWTWTRVANEAEPMGDILLIDDDEGNSFDEFYGQLLTNLNKPFTRWNVNSRVDNYPDKSYLKHFNTVIWLMGEKSLNTIGNESSNEYLDIFNRRHLFETSLTQYLAEGGSLFLSGQDFLDDKESAMISREVLHTFFHDSASTIPTIDRDITAQTITGVPGHPISDGLGTFDLIYPDGFTDLTDRIFVDDSSLAQPLFSSNGDANRFVAASVDACSYRAVFLAFPLEAMNEMDAQLLLSQSLNWLQENANMITPKLISVSPNNMKLSEINMPIQLEINGHGFALLNGYRAYLDNTALLNEEQHSCNMMTAEMPATLEAGSYTLRVVTGAGHELILPNAVVILDEPPVAIHDWQILD